MLCPLHYSFLYIFRIFATDQVRIHGSRLRIVNATSEHNGVYSCNVRNGAGDITSDDDFLLNVRGELRYVNAKSFALKVYVRKFTLNFYVREFTLKFYVTLIEACPQCSNWCVQKDVDQFCLCRRGKNYIKYFCVKLCRIHSKFWHTLSFTLYFMNSRQDNRFWWRIYWTWWKVLCWLVDG